MADDFDPFASSSPTESDVDAAYDRYIKNLEKSVSDLSDDEVMKDVLDSFFASKGEDPQSLSLPTPENRLKLYKTLELEPPSPSEVEITSGSRSWYNDPEQGYNLLAPPMTYEEFLKRRYGLDLGDIMAGPSEPRPPDQSNLPAAIDAAAEASRLALPPDDEPRTKKKTFGSGVGSLMRRRMFPLIQALQQGYEHLLTEEQKNDVREFLAQPTHEFFGFEKSGLESLKEKLGISDDDMPGETFSVIEGRTEKPLDEVSQSTIKRRLRAAKNELSDLTGIPVKRDVTQRIQRRIQKLSKEDPLLEKRLSNLVERIYDLKERISPDTRFGPVPDLPDSYFQSMARQREETEGTLFRALGSLPSEYLGVESDWFPQDLGRILSNLSPDRIRSIDALLKQRDGRGLLDHTFPKTRNDMLIRIDPDRPQVDSETVRARIQDILDPEPPSYLRLVDEEPPGLPMDLSSRLSRMHEMGFDLDAYHGTTEGDPAAWDPENTVRESFPGSDRGYSSWPADIGDWFTENPYVASSGFAEGEGGHVIPVKLRLKNPAVYPTYEDLESALAEFPDTEEFREYLQKKGHDGILIENSFTDVPVSRKDYVVFDSKNIRSRFARFDPADSESGDISKAHGGFVVKPLYDS